MMSLRVVLTQITPVSPRVKKFRFEAAEGELPLYSPGSHFRLHLPVGGGRANAYSLVGDGGHDGAYEIAVRRESPEKSKGGSIYLHDVARVGGEFAAAPAENHFAPVRNAPRHLMLAAGIGITPFLSYLPALRRWGAAHALYYSYRGSGGAPFVEELAGLPEVTLHDSARNGRLPAGEILDSQPAGTHVYVCGPHGFVEAVRAHCAATGWAPERVHSEQFAPKEFPPGRPFRARLARSGREIPVPAGTTLLEALEAGGIEVPFSCRVGGCGTCLLPVIRGEIDHRDDCLPPARRAEGRQIISCVSRCHSEELVLDL